MHGLNFPEILARYGGFIGLGRTQASYDRETRKCAANAAQRRKLAKHRKAKAKSDKRHGKRTS